MMMRTMQDADWGWGHGWCGNCHGSTTLIDDNGRRFSARGCPPDGSPQGPDLYNFYCSDNKASDLIANVLPALKGRYLAIFNELLSQVTRQHASLLFGSFPSQCHVAQQR